MKMHFKLNLCGEKLSPSSKEKLKAYVNGLSETDRSMQKLIEYLNNSEKPTIVAFYGDHLPSLYEVYLDSGMISDRDTTKWSTEEMAKMHTLPFFIYDNYKNEEVINTNEMVGAFSIGNYLLNYAGVEKTPYFNFIDKLKYKALRDRLFIDENGKANSSISEKYEEESNEHKMLIYDMIYGNNYISKYVKNARKN